MQNIAAALGYGQPLHLVIYALLIIFFCFFYTALVFNARDTADNLKKSNAFIPGIRPGQQTADYIDKVMTRLTLWGALYVTAVLSPAGDSGFLARRAVPFRGYVAADRRGGRDGFHVAAPGAHDVASLSGSSQEGQFARLRPAGLGWVKNESSSFSQEDLQELQDRAPPAHHLRHLLVGTCAISSVRADHQMIFRKFQVECRVFSRGLTGK